MKREEIRAALKIPSVLLCAGIFLCAARVFPQAENVPVYHPVYTFLKRMDVRGVISGYDDTVLPLSRRQVAEFLVQAEHNTRLLTDAERGWLRDFLSEFQFDIKGSVQGFHSLFASPAPGTESGADGMLGNREKYLYLYTDSTLSFFFTGLFDLDARAIRGDSLGTNNAEFIQGGGRFRGTIWGKLGYELQGTNAEFWGSRALLEMDPQISQSYALHTLNERTFDFTEGYVRYDGGILSAQLGRERVHWGNGYDQQMVLSDNPRQFDFARADFRYKAVGYTFLHAWLLGNTSTLAFTLPSDTTATFYETVNPDKYFAAHRFSLSFPEVVTVGFQEMYIYSNRAPDLGYLNPLALFESVQRSREQRDNGLWAFDAKTHFLRDIQLTATLLFDDIHLGSLFGNDWFNKYAWQWGMYYAEPFSIPNTTMMVEYTRVQPYVFSHGNSREDSYSSLGVLLGPRIGPNADSWFIRWDYLPARNLFFSARVTFERKGENIVDASGRLIRNVGGDFLQPHRDSDPATVQFLDGILVKTRTFQFVATCELINQLWIDAGVAFLSVENEVTSARSENATAMLRMRTEL